MLFCSTAFLFLFLPLSLIIYRITKERYKNLVLLLLGILFYAMSDFSHLWLLLLTVGVNYIFCRISARRRDKARLVLTLCLVFDISTLFIFKYLGLFGVALALPVGISFYTFQCISYAKDVYDGDKPSDSFIDFAAYITMYPQLVAGPIVKYGDIRQQLTEKRYRMGAGVRRFVFGLAKKMILANYAGELFIRGFESGESLGGWIGILGYMFQIYFDFSGYSDMAIGLGHMLGFDFPENFNYPYISSSIKEFWRRWHITLSSFFRDYLYIPLGGSRCSRLRNLFNLFVVWALTGLWHGAGLNFLFWGLYFFLLLWFERSVLYKKTVGALPSVLRRTITLFLILFGWLIFSSESLSSLAQRLQILFLAGGAEKSGWLLLTSLFFLLICALFSTPLPIKIYQRLGPLRAPTVILLFIISVAYIAGTGYNPFLYFRF